MVTIEEAVRSAREAVAERGLDLGEIFWARLTDENDRWIICFQLKLSAKVVMIPDRVTVVVDAGTGRASML